MWGNGDRGLKNGWVVYRWGRDGVGGDGMVRCFGRRIFTYVVEKRDVFRE